MRSATALLAVMSAAAYAARAADPVGTRAVEQIAKDQAAAQNMRGQVRRSARAATDVLVKASNASVVLCHIHPRWLREEVARRLDAGEDVDEARIAELRAAGRP